MLKVPNPEPTLTDLKDKFIMLRDEIDRFLQHLEDRVDEIEKKVDGMV